MWLRIKHQSWKKSPPPPSKRRWENPLSPRENPSCDIWMVSSQEEIRECVYYYEESHQHHHLPKEGEKTHHKAREIPSCDIWCRCAAHWYPLVPTGGLVCQMIKRDQQKNPRLMVIRQENYLVPVMMWHDMICQRNDLLCWYGKKTIYRKVKTIWSLIWQKNPRLMVIWEGNDLLCWLKVRKL